MASDCACHASSNAGSPSLRRRGPSGSSGRFKVTFPSINEHTVLTGLRFRPQIGCLKCDGVEGFWFDHTASASISKRLRSVMVLDHADAATYICRQAGMKGGNRHLGAHFLANRECWLVIAIGKRLLRCAAALGALFCYCGCFAGP